jgi:Rrf2 family protein
MTRRSTYAVRALFRLAQISPDQPQLTSEIAAAEGIPRRFLEAILRELSRHGILQGRRGRGGGYALRSSPDQISIATIIRIVDGPLVPFPCMDPVGRARCAECPGNEPCVARLVLSEMVAASLGALERMTLADLVGRVRELGGELGPVRPGALRGRGGVALPRV